MADKSKIEWTDATWNPITGCSRVSKGCEHCYAETLAAGRLRHHPSRLGLTDEHGRWNGMRCGSTSNGYSSRSNGRNPAAFSWWRMVIFSMRPSPPMVD